MNKSILTIGNRFKRLLMATKKNGFFDWQYTEHNGMIILEFYWDTIDNDYIFYLYDFMKSNEKYNPILKGGIHDQASNKQIMLTLTVKI